MEGPAQDTIFGWGDRVDKVDLSDSPERGKKRGGYFYNCTLSGSSVNIVVIWICRPFSSGEQVG